MLYWVDDLSIEGELQNIEEEELREETELGSGTVNHVRTGLSSWSGGSTAFNEGSDDEEGAQAEVSDEEEMEQEPQKKSKKKPGKQKAKEEDVEVVEEKVGACYEVIWNMREDDDDIDATLNELLTEQNKLSKLCDKLEAQQGSKAEKWGSYSLEFHACKPASGARRTSVPGS